ncbi:MAG: SDR family oxidoreductase [bacterium]|nr:SDR family oxidoreductase [bacterium]
MFKLTGKVAAVTGGTGVLGEVMCRALAKAGAAVAVMGTTEEKTRRLAESIQADGGRALGVAVDVTEKASLEAALSRTLDAFQQVDLLVNAAGGNKPQASTSPTQAFFDLPAEALREVVDLNLVGTLLPAQVFGKHMAERQSGNIINISSMAASRPLTRVLAYGGAKAAVDNFTRWAAVHFAKEYSPNIRVNAIAPGFFLTEQNRFLLTDKATGDLTPRGKAIIEHTPQGRFGEPDDLIGTLLWLASDASRFVTGIVVPVDGGFSAFSGV